MNSLVLTVIGDDRPGLVHALAEVIAAHDANWERSRMANLAGTFAGIVEVSAPADRSYDLLGALTGLQGGLDVTVRTLDPIEADATAPESQAFTLDLLGDDHPGIVEQITGVLARHGVNVDEIATESSEAPMAGGRVFHLDALVHAPADTDRRALQEDLEALARDLMVDISLDPTDG